MFEQPGKRRSVSRRDCLSATLESDASTVNNSQKAIALQVTAMDCHGRSLGTAQRDNTFSNNGFLNITTRSEVFSPAETESQHILPHSNPLGSPAAKLATSAAASPSAAKAFSDAESIDESDDDSTWAPPSYYKLDMQPHDVCDHCWRYVFPTGFGLRDAPVRFISDQVGWSQGATYTISHDELLACKSSGCMWYRSLGEEIFGEMIRWFEGQSQTTMIVRVGTQGQLCGSQRADEELTVVIVEDDNPQRDFRLSINADNHATAWIRDWAGTVHVTIPDALSWAKARAEECSREHEACRDFSKWARLEASLPARLIGCSDPLRPRVVDTGALDPQVQYVALSYVWGGEQPNRTTVENLRTYQKTIDLALLPKTIVDAIRVTHGLGIRYLWTDSMCIIQDSREDKHQELAGMRDVYRHAFLTIDAGGAERASEGFLGDSRGIPMDASEWLQFAWSRRHKGRPRQLTVDLLSQDTYPISHDRRQVRERVFAYHGIGSHTQHRAWCLQEKLMSARVLLFISDVIVFSCRTSQKDPLHYIGYPPIPDLIFHPQPSVVRGTHDWKLIHEAWAEIVHDYSRRSLSYAEDKLVACAGVAEFFDRALGPQAEYLAGLWRDSLLFDLCWYQWVQTGRCSLGDPCAPSWSWAAQGHAVQFRGSHFSTEEYIPLSEVVECATTPEDPILPFGRVTAGHLLLRTPLFGPYDLNYLRSISSVFLDEDDKGDIQMDESTSMWIVPLLYRHEDSSSREVRGLVVHLYMTQSDTALVGSSSEYTGIYQRAGYCEVSSWQCREKVIIGPLVDLLGNGVDGRWDFPRTVIQLV